jgi:putative heme-binding domain-containing protein
MKHFVLFFALAGCVDRCARAQTPTLESELVAQQASELAEQARREGDAQRGAVVFYQSQLACTRCHPFGDQGQRLGPDLSKLDTRASDEHLIESILFPSKVIRQGFETVHLAFTDGRQISGVLVDSDEQSVTVLDSAKNFQLLKFRKDELDTIRSSPVSIMPAGQVNLLAGRQEFLDLIRYLMEIRDGGPARARELQPPALLSLQRPPPEYEQHIDHAGILLAWDDDAFRRGEAIYNQLCVNCHGTHARPGSLPTSLKFAEGSFKNGNDPYSMYQTLTRGFGMMAPQTWMVPRQKYDVIHYIREAYLKEHNSSQYFRVDQGYLNQLPPGDSRGPEPSTILPWEQMDYGPNLVMTLEIGQDGTNIAYKGNAVRLDGGPGGVSQGRHWLVFDYDTLRVAGAWSGKGFCDWKGINFDGQHNVHPRATGTIHLANPVGPGWGNPQDGSFEDRRLVGRDGRRYGPLPRSWAHYKGMYYHGAKTIIRYTVGDTELLEMPGVLTSASTKVFTRCFNIGPRSRDLVLQVAHCPEPDVRLQLREPGDIAILASLAESPTATAGSKTGPASIHRTTLAGLVGDHGDASWFSQAGNLRLRISAGPRPLKFYLWFAGVSDPDQVHPVVDSIVMDDPDPDLHRFTRGGPSRWPQLLSTRARLGDDDQPFAVDVLTHPVDNPWFCRMRLTGLDFTADGNQLVVCDWDGGVWLISGIGQLPDDRASGTLANTRITWRRIASGLFQPLGLKIVDNKIHVTCRDQLCVLHDLNGDSEIDYYENFNNDHQVTDHFHEFAMGLQVDSEGNFYYAKSARHALPALVPHHGTLLRVSKDGTTTDILATGFRAANGVCLNPDGTFIVTDQEGHWNPKNRINYVKTGRFYGNMLAYHDVTDSSDSAMDQPLCWITNQFDRSPAELLWVDSPRWKSLDHRLLNLSYGYGMVYIVPHEDVDGQKQGGMCQFPIERMPTGIMRGRFHPVDGQLYVCGMYSWAGNQTQPGGLFRLRYTGQPVHLPIELHAKSSGMEITFSDTLDPVSASNADHYSVKVWSLKRTENYGSPHYDEQFLEVASARVEEDGRTVFLEIPRISPTWCMEIAYRIRAPDGKRIDGKIHNTIHKLAD